MSQLSDFFSRKSSQNPKAPAELERGTNLLKIDHWLIPIWQPTF